MDSEKDLLLNFELVQSKINEIKSNWKNDIKQISDLERYIQMQKIIFETLILSKKYNQTSR